MASVQDQFDAIFGAPRPGRAPDAPGHADPSAAADPAAAAATNDAALQLAATALFRHAHHPAVPAPAAASGFAADAVVPTAIGSTPVVDAAGPAPAIVPTVPAVGAHPAATASGSAAVPATTVLAAAVPAAAPAPAAVVPAAATSATPAPIVSVPTFFAGNLVLSVYGNGDGSGTYTDNQASPITLEQVTAAGAIVNDYVLPQSDSTDPVTGATEHAVSGEYGSSSEGSLSLSADGRSLVIMGYGVDAATYNAGGAAVYGNAALAQSTSIPGGPFTAVSRVVADIGADGTVDTSTAVFGVFNTNNGRSAATTDGSSFYISGQGVKGDTTQGLFRVADGASAATAIDTSTDTRTAVLFDGTLYVSRDTKQGPTANISSYGGEPTAATAPTVLAGLSNKITLTAAEANTVNAGSVGKSVFLSPENFFFADPNTLYVADGGNPKGGGIGDGGLQKWSLASGTWTLDYTLSAGLNLVKNSATTGTTGLIGLTGQVSGGTVTLYATNATVGDLDPTYLFGITDQLSATAAAPAGESFTTLVTAAADTNIRGVSFAPQLACFVRGTRLLTAAGAVPVEDLEPGAPMLVERDGRRVVEPATWIGRRRIDLRAHPEPALVRPVRLLPGALGDGIPSATLRLSPDHAVRQDGSLVPVRFLLNGASIAAEFPDAVEYFHVELPSHGILLAEDAPVESFLDTGNRAQFGTEPVFPLHPVFAPGPLPARTVLPVETDPAALEALWHACAARSDRLGHPVAAAATTRDPALRLRLPDGTELHPVPASGTDPAHPDRFRFRLPAALGPDGAAVILLSRAAAPAATRPWLDDRRSLGIAVRGLVAWSGSRALPLAPGGGAGWWAPEAAPASTPGSAAASWCWTDGAAVIALPSGTDRLELDLFAVADYPPAVPDHREPRRAA